MKHYYIKQLNKEVAYIKVSHETITQNKISQQDLGTHMPLLLKNMLQ